MAIFSKINPKNFEAELTQKLSDNLSLIEHLLTNNQSNTWENLIAPMEVAENELNKLWSPISHMNAVVNTPELRDTYNNCLPKLSEYATEIGQNKRLFQAIQSIRQDEEKQLNQAQKKSLDDDIRSFKLSGVDLSGEKKARYKAISSELSQLSSNFSDNVLDATNGWFKHISDKTELKGLPEYALAMAEQAAQERNLEGWVITLDFPSYHAVVTYADDTNLRKEVYRAYTTRASEQGEKPEFDNTEIMQKLLKLKKEKAEILGFSNYAELSVESKMAKSASDVVTFLEDLGAKAKPFAEKEVQALQQFAEQELHIDKLNAWDMAYASEKLKQQQYDISDEELKPYFAVNTVLAGLFQLTEKLYSVKISLKMDGIDTWHDDVLFYQIHNSEGELQAEFYLDLYARQHKRGGAWMDDYCSRFRQGEHLQTPVAYMTCNSTPPIGDEPALFTHDEVVTLFHEFGHGLHHMLTQVEYLDISGINGVEWDAVELPSQFMENWCWEKESLTLFAKHHETGEIIPDALINKMQASKNFQSAMAMLRQIEFSLFDMKIHMKSDASKAGKITEILQQVREEISVIQPPEFNRFQNSFSHIFAGGYSAGYYSYKWAEVLSEDAFARFEEEGLFNQKVSKAFLEEILQVGGSRPAMESFKAFRGREPSPDALLRRAGLQ